MNIEGGGRKVCWFIESFDQVCMTFYVVKCIYRILLPSKYYLLSNESDYIV